MRHLISASTVVLLVEAGLVERERRGKWAWYRVVPEQLNLLRDALSPAALVSRDL